VITAYVLIDMLLNFVCKYYLFILAILGFEPTALCFLGKDSLAGYSNLD
jgi:hypothetical protein